MKLEIEITEEEIKSAMERKVRIAIADQTNQWGTDAYIKTCVAEHWKKSVDTMVQELLKDAPAMRKKITESIEAKFRAQLNQAMKVTK